jgi:hypothetical protein
MELFNYLGERRRAVETSKCIEFLRPLQMRQTEELVAIGWTEISQMEHTL